MLFWNIPLNSEAPPIARVTKFWKAFLLALIHIELTWPFDKEFRGGFE